jgi:hypothetical protein
MEPTYGDFDFDDVAHIEKLRAEIRKMADSDDPAGILSDLFMNGHEGSGGYISFGNTKISKSVAIFNMNSATDCPNADTENCQVPWDDCYAHVAENGLSPDALDKRRRQEYLWDNVDVVTFAEGMRRCFDRKQHDITAVRFSESGDFRHDTDIIRVNRVAELLDTDVYTYSASDYLDWSEATAFTVNQSNDRRDYGDRLYTAVPTEDDIPEDAVQCAYEGAEIKCGDCRMCIDKDFDKDVYITLH